MLGPYGVVHGFPHALCPDGGCVGVMAAEVKNGGEQQEELLAAATVVAAQLATLVGPPSVRGRSEAAS